MVVILRGGVKFVQSTGFQVALVTTSVPTPAGTYDPFIRGQVGVVIGEGALSGI